MAQVIVDTSTDKGKFLNRTLEILVFEKTRPRSTLGILWDIAQFNQLSKDQNQVHALEARTDDDSAVPDDNIAILYSNGDCLLFPIIIEDYITNKIDEHFANLDLLPNSELRT